MSSFGLESSRFPFRNRQRSPLTLRNSQLSFETLESRQMMAADMAEIIGVVRTDLQGDGDTNNDVVLAGAVVTLFRDNGNGSFDANDVQLTSESTNSLGQYSFDGL